MISMTFLLLTGRHAPLNNTGLDVSAFITQMCTFLTLGFALLLKVDFFTSAPPPLELSR